MGLTTLLSMVVLGALVVAFEAFGVVTFRGAHGDVRKQHGDEACLDVHGSFVTWDLPRPTVASYCSGSHVLVRLGGAVSEDVMEEVVGGFMVALKA